jgi:hypothetical protein
MLSSGLAKHYKDLHYNSCESMTDIIELNIKNVIRQVNA